MQKSGARASSVAAIAEFARGGYNGTSTEAIAKRVGVSQPYLFRLFPSKQAIFLAASDRCLEDTRKVFAEAADGLEGEEALQAMAAAYQRLIADDPDKLLMQMQMYVAVAAAEAAGDHEFGESVRAGWLQMWDEVHLAARRRCRRDHDLPGVRHAHQHPGLAGLPARPPGLGRVLSLGPAEPSEQCRPGCRRRFSARRKLVINN